MSVTSVPPFRSVGYAESTMDILHTNKLKLNEELAGECISLKNGDFRCECTGTGYYGETCHKGEEADVDVIAMIMMMMVKLVMIGIERVIVIHLHLRVTYR